MARSSNTSDKDSEDRLMRLQKFLAAAGVASRRESEEYIRGGRVMVDGEVVQELGYKVDPKRQKVELDFEPLKIQRKKYYLLNKPPGYVSTHKDPQGRPRVIDLFPQEKERLFTVGRLDENSQGLLLVTNDGEMANKLAHPRYQVPRTYRVQVVGKPSRETLDQLKKGMHFKEGKFRVKGARRVGSKGKSTFLELVLTEGRNREIRRLLARAGHKVIHLERIGFGPLSLGRLSPGRHRRLKDHELKALRKLIEGRGKNGSSGRRKKAPRKTKKKK